MLFLLMEEAYIVCLFCPPLLSKARTAFKAVDQSEVFKLTFWRNEALKSRAFKQTFQRATFALLIHFPNFQNCRFCLCPVCLCLHILLISWYLQTCFNCCWIDILPKFIVKSLRLNGFCMCSMKWHQNVNVCRCLPVFSMS